MLYIKEKKFLESTSYEVFMFYKFTIYNKIGDVNKTRN